MHGMTISRCGNSYGIGVWQGLDLLLGIPFLWNCGSNLLQYGIEIFLHLRRICLF